MTQVSPTPRRRAFLQFLGLAGLASLGSAGSLFATEPRVTTPPYNTFTEEEELALGRQFAAKYESKVEILSNPLIDAYLNDIVKKLGDASQRPQWPYQIKVVNDSDINASAIPGGFLYLHRGLLEFVSDENEMVGAIAHEVGHVVARHTTNQLSLLLIAQHVFDQVKHNILMDNDLFGQVLQQLGGPVVVLAQLRYSRQNESEADLLGFYEMLRAGWNPNGLYKFFTRLQQKTGSQNPVEVMLSDHPATEERARVMRRELESINIPSGLREQTFQFQALKLALGVMPAAPRPVRQ
jgi:predicted Zn-dependent protease